MLKAFLYDAAGHDTEVELAGGPSPKLTSERILWVDAVGNDALDPARLSKMLGIDAEILGTISRQDSAPISLNNYGDYVHFSVMALAAVEHRKGGAPPLPQSQRLEFLVGKNWLITLSNVELPFLSDFRARDRGETLIGKLSSGTLAASLLDWHLSAYFSALEDLEGWLDLLDIKLIASKSVDRSLLTNVAEGRRFVARMRRNLGPQRPVFYGLARPDFPLTTDTQSRDAFQALERRYDRLIDALEHSRELVRGSFDLFSTTIAESTNVLVRRLTFISIAIGGIGTVAGIFGMNFETPLTNSGATGFWLVIGSLTMLVVAGYILSRSRGWL